MNLHTPGKKPDWHNVPDAERNTAQRIAAKTHGLVTPGNAFTLAGYLTTKSGFNDLDRGRTIRAASKIFVGRLFDLVDGWIADKTGTKSEIGETGDILADGLLMKDSLELLERHKIAPKTVTRSYKALAIANAVSAAKAKTSGIEAHSSLTGKVSTFKKWGSFVCFMASHAFAESGNEKASKKARNIATLTSIGAIGIGAHASFGYFKNAFYPSSAEEQQDFQYAESGGSNYNPDDAQSNKNLLED